jgi:hypothetical protein
VLALNYVRLAALFKMDGVWKRQGEVLVGAEQIIRALSKRSTTQRIRHVISNTFLPRYESDEMDVISYMTAYRFDDGTNKDGVARIARPFLLSIVHARLEKNHDIWHIADLDLVPQFEFVGEQQV